MDTKEEWEWRCEVGRVLVQIMKDKNWNQARLAEALDVDDGQVRKWRLGHRTPKPETVENWARLPGVASYIEGIRRARRSDLSARAAAAEKEASERASRPSSDPAPDSLAGRFSTLVERLGNDPSELGALYSILGNMLDSEWQIAKTLVMKAALLAVKQSREAESVLNEPPRHAPEKRAGSA
jgi:transcriptional regulator with XRE-family HTH domain